jgi:DNA polymerase-3 subunit alpha
VRSHRQQGQGVKSDTNRYNHLVLLCENQTGYRNLIQLVSSGYLDGFYYKPRIDKDLLSRHSEGLIALSACLRGDINETLLADRYDEAKRLAYEYSDLFGKKNFFLELQNHGLDEDSRVLPHIHRLAGDTGIPLVATNDSHYLRQDDARAHEILLCIQTGKTMSDPNRMRLQPAFYLKRAGDDALFGEVEENNRTYDIAQRCQVTLPVGAVPEIPVPPEHCRQLFRIRRATGFEAARAPRGSPRPVEARSR